MINFSKNKGGRWENPRHFKYFQKMRKEADLKLVVHAAKIGLRIFLKGITKLYSREDILASWQLRKMLSVLVYLIEGAQFRTMCIFKYAAEDGVLAKLAHGIVSYDFPSGYGTYGIDTWTRAYLRNRHSYLDGDRSYTEFNEYHFIER